MGSLRLKLSSVQRLRWPPSCAVCGAKAEDHAVASISTSKNFRYYGILLRWTKNTFSVPFPVCRRHKILCLLLDLPAQWGFIDAFIYLILVPGILWIVSTLLLASLWELKGAALEPFTIASGIFFYGLMALFYFLAATIKPVKLYRIDETSLTISIKNEDCFKAFQLLNSRVDS